MRCLMFHFAAALLSAASVLAQYNPFDALDTQSRSPYADPAVYAEHKATWLYRVEAAPDSVDVLEAAADFFLILDRPLAKELLKRARAIEPNSARWVRKLAMLHKMNADQGDVAEARLALTEMERAYAMTPQNERPYITELAQMAFDAGDFLKARQYAERLLSEATRNPKSWNFGNAVHRGNLVLGRIAVREGRFADAVSFLRASVEIPGSPTLGSFGPNMSLASDLLEHGEREAVLAYFELCRVFWKMGGSRLDAWKQEVEAGRIPRFGPNLRY